MIPRLLVLLSLCLAGVGYGAETYVVIRPKSPTNCIDNDGSPVGCVGPRIDFKGQPWSRCSPVEACQDLAYSLNEAHERRTEKKVKLIRATDTGTRFDFDYKSACGDSDCGKEP